jgi:hypothetical protein
MLRSASAGADRGARARGRRRQDGFGYFLEMARRPQTIGYAMLDSPVALVAWLLDHDTDSYGRLAALTTRTSSAGACHQLCPRLGGNGCEPLGERAVSRSTARTDSIPPCPTSLEPIMEAAGIEPAFRSRRLAFRGLKDVESLNE